MDEKVTGICIH